MKVARLSALRSGRLINFVTFARKASKIIIFAWPHQLVCITNKWHNFLKSASMNSTARYWNISIFVASTKKGLYMKTHRRICALQEGEAPKISRQSARPAGLSQWKTPITLSEIEYATFHLVAQCLNQLRHRVPSHSDRNFSGREMFVTWDAHKNKTHTRMSCS